MEKVKNLKNEILPGKRWKNMKKGETKCEKMWKKCEKMWKLKNLEKDESLPENFWKKGKNVKKWKKCHMSKLK